MSYEKSKSIFGYVSMEFRKRPELEIKSWESSA